jgi:hypothetical protein
MKISFPSIANENSYVYTFDSYSYNNSSAICSDFLYKKINDEKWSLDHSVTVDLLGDYLASLSLAMLSNDDLSREISWKLPSEVNKNEIEFASSITYKSGSKTRYYSMELRKISSVQSKKYDRRFEQINSDMDGSPRSIFELITGNNGWSNLYKYGLAAEIRDWLFNNGNKRTKRKSSYMQPPAEFLNWTSDDTKVHEIRNGWEACKFAIASYQAKQNVASSISCFKNYALQSKLEK